MVKLTIATWSAVVLMSLVFGLTAVMTTHGGLFRSIHAPSDRRIGEKNTLTANKSPQDIPHCTSCGLTLPAIRLSSSPVVASALELGSVGNQAFRFLVDYAASSGVQVVLQQPDDLEAVGSFDPRSRLIRLSPGVAHEPAAVTSSILIHEIVHANQTYEPGADACFSREVVAYSWQASTFERLRTGGENTALARLGDQIVTLWRLGQLEQFVRSSPLYQRQCLGAR